MGSLNAFLFLNLFFKLVCGRCFGNSTAFIHSFIHAGMYVCIFHLNFHRTNLLSIYLPAFSSVLNSTDLVLKTKVLILIHLLNEYEKQPANFHSNNSLQLCKSSGRQYYIPLERKFQRGQGVPSVLFMLNGRFYNSPDKHFCMNFET